MPEQHITVGDVELCHETFGREGDPAVLLIMGLGTQMLGWREGFCRRLADEGYFVIRYDNRDVGLSTHFSGHRPPSVLELVTRRPRALAYTLEDMADDAAGLLDALGIDAAHVVGASMGGMIAQLVAVRHPGRVRTLTSIMSTTGAGRVGQPGLKVLPFLLKPPASDREAAVERIVKLFDLVGSPGFERDVAGTRELAGVSFDRSSDRSGAGRQLAAILASGNREPLLRTVTAPTLVIHGDADKMVAPSGGKATAKAIPNARLELIRGMGHDLPEGAWDQVIGLITTHARRADERAASSGVLGQA